MVEHIVAELSILFIGDERAIIAAEIIDVIGPKKSKVYKGQWHVKDHYGIWVKNVVRLKSPVKVSFPNGVINRGDLKWAALKKCLAQVPSAKRKKVLSHLAGKIS